MVNFAELKAKAERAKDTTVTKVTNTRDRYSSAPSSQVTWDPNWKRTPPGTASPRASMSTSMPGGGPPPTPLRSRPDIMPAGTGPPTVPRASRPSDDVPAPPPYTALPPPTRAASGYSPSHRETPQGAVDRIDWANLSPDDKEVFFGWLDEFFSRYLGIELGPRERSAASSVPAALFAQRPPPIVNMATRPQE